MSPISDCDIIIIGAGPVGLSFASTLRAAGLRVAMIERLAEPLLAEPAYDGRDIALTWRSVHILRQLGIWERVPAHERFPIHGARVLNGRQTSGLEIRPPAVDNIGELGFLVSNHLLRRAAYETVRSDATTQLLTGCAMQSVHTDGQWARVTLANGLALRARLLVAADSRFSDTRRALGIPARHFDFGKTMLVCRMRHSVPHEHIACEWFGHHQTLAALPLADHHSSIVLTLPHAEIERVRSLGPEEFGREMRSRFLGRLGTMSLESERFAYPLVAVYPERFIATRGATIGDAAVGMHPVTAHGFNLGLVGQDTLARLILGERDRHGAVDAGAPRILRAFDTAHRRATRPLYLATNAIVRLYTDDSGPARLAREALLRVAARVPVFASHLSRLLMQAN